VLPASGPIVGYAAQRAPADRPLEPDDPVDRAEAVRIERWLDEALGPYARQWVYFQLEGERELGRQYNLTGVPRWQKAGFPIAYAPLYRVVERFLDVTPQTAADAERRVNAVFDAVDARLADGRPYLVGDRFSRADLTFAALSAAVLAPEDYGVPLPGLDEVSPEMAAGVRAFRAHPAGAFARRIYAEHRRR
jgi:glutathione S-transferase